MSTLQGDLEQYSSPAGPSTGGSLPGEIEQFSAYEGTDIAGRERRWKEDLCHAICGNNWIDTKVILDQNPDALTAGITPSRKTALHVAAMFGNVTIVEELLKLLPPEFLLTGDSYGDTALVLACWRSGITQVAKCLKNKNKDILGIPSTHDNLPVIVAFSNGYTEMGRYLYSVTPLEFLKGRWGSKLIRTCLISQCFDIVLNLLQKCQELLLVPINDGGTWTPIHDIATLNATIHSPSEFIFWKRWIYNYINIPSTTIINHVYVDIQQEDRSQGDNATLTQPGHDLLLRLITSADSFVGVKKIRELKLMHAQADHLLRLVCENARKAYQKGFMDKALRLAAKEGNVEFVFQVSKEIPEIVLGHTINSCFNEALEYRQAGVFNLIHGLRFKNSVVIAGTGNANALLHKAAIKAPDHVLNRIYSPTLQMQRELQWFKEVESLTPPNYRGSRNKEGMTVEESFRKSHKELMKEGEKWIKATASSCSVVGALIVTIMFAAAFTVPGGNDQSLGYPLFIKQSFFKVFIFSTVLSLLFSSTSVLMFLAILTSQYSEDKFLKSLPTKLILGLSFLFMSIVCMIIAFLSTIRLMLKQTNYSWGLLPITIVASVPIFLFVLSQFPLLLHTCKSTYGNIFDRKVKQWP